MSGEVIENLADVFEKELMSKNSSANLTNLADEIYKYKIYVSSSLSLFVGMTQIIMVIIYLKYFASTF